MRYYEVTVPVAALGTDPVGSNLPLRIVVTVPAGLTSNDPASDATASVVKHHTITVSEYVDATDVPGVVSIQRLRPGSQTVVSAFQEERIPADPFNVRIVLTAPAARH